MYVWCCKSLSVCMYFGIMCVCVFGVVSLSVSGSLIALHFIFWDKISSSTSSSLPGQETQGSSCLPLQCWDCRCVLSWSCGCWRSKLKFSSLQGRPFTDKLSSYAPLIPLAVQSWKAFMSSLCFGFYVCGVWVSRAGLTGEWTWPITDVICFPHLCNHYHHLFLVSCAGDPGMRSKHCTAELCLSPRPHLQLPKKADSCRPSP